MVTYHLNTMLYMQFIYFLSFNPSLIKSLTYSKAVLLLNDITATYFNQKPIKKLYAPAKYAKN